MPVIDGTEAAAQIRQLQNGRATTPIIAFSANVTVGTPDDGDETPETLAHFHGFVGYPFKLKDIIEAVDEVIGSAPTHPAQPS